jgi:hypothetical protein
MIADDSAASVSDALATDHGSTAPAMIANDGTAAKTAALTAGRGGAASMVANNSFEFFSALVM